MSRSPTLGIEKNHDFNLDPSDVGKVTDHVASLISKRRGAVIAFQGATIGICMLTIN